ncbi:MAG TPA: DUF3857 domain-containing protein [Bryobacteraceae bacterium]
MSPRRKQLHIASWLVPHLCLFLVLAGTAFSASQSPDYSKEAAVIQEFSRDITFAADGTSVRDQSAVVRIQSDAGASQYGILSFYYDQDTQKVDIVYVRVRKPDGSVVTTPPASVQDLSSEIERLAPTYSDLREKQVPVRGLSPGDVLEYRVRITQTKPNIPGRFWDAENFLSGAVVLQETLRISVPAGKYVKVVSASVKPQIHEQGGRKIYLWKTAQLKPTADKRKAKSEPTVPDVQVTTFKSWDEVGRWYGHLVTERAIVTPAVQAKEAELTKGLATVSEKRKAIYDYVSTKFRYISLSFGIGRYQPHFAQDVLANEYGDCKDKHTLFVALLKAAGIEAWPALIGAGLKVDPDVPSPAQFNHVITVLPDPKGLIWLDTTPEVAPFGLLRAGLRGKKALVIPNDGAAYLTTTPADPPFATSEVIAANGSLAADGTLKAHFDVTLRGDAELLFRTIFRRIPNSKWQPFIQRIMDSTNLSDGSVSNVSVANPEDLDPPLHYSYDYVRKNYIDEAKHRFILPLFPYHFTESDKKPKKPVPLPAPGQVIYRATVQLPEGFSVKLPPAVDLHTEFASYHASYKVAGDVLSAERRLSIAKSKVPLSTWDQYHKFVKQISDDEDEYVAFSTPPKPAAAKISAQAKAPAGNPQAAALMEKAIASIKAKDMNAARDELDEAARLNPKQPGLWWTRSSLLFREGDLSGALDALQKEVDLHPKEVRASMALGRVQAYYGHRGEAIETLRAAVKLAPDDIPVVSALSSLLLANKRYKEVIELVRSPLAKTPGNRSLQFALTEALLRDGQKKEGLADVQKLATKFTDSMSLNNAAFLLADTSTDLPLACQYAEKAVSQLESASKQITLSSFKNADLGRVTLLAAAWDTLGWAYFQSGNTQAAEAYIKASWLLSQNGTVADHLGQLYARQGKKTQAIHVWQLALAANGRLKDVRKRLENLGVSTGPTPVELLRQASQGHPATGPSKERAELSQLRTTKIRGIPKQQASAEFFLLFSASKVEDAQFISGSPALKSAIAALLKAHYNMPFPDKGPERIVRRGILSCSTYASPSCEFVFLLPSTAGK